MKGMPKDETIKKWIESSKSKKAFEKEMLRRLDVLEKDYKSKKAKLQYILKRLRSL
jgi:hypothetical protein